MMIVGIAGRIGAGKDVVANYLTRHHGFQVIRFSDALKREVITRLPRTLTAIANQGGNYPLSTESHEEFLFRLVHVLKPLGIRELLQEYGTEVRRKDDPAYWTKAWGRALEALDSRQAVVAPDTRFPNEARAIKNAGGKVIRVERKGLKASTHESETALLDWPYDAVFDNDGTVEDLERRVAEWVLKR